MFNFERVGKGRKSGGKPKTKSTEWSYKKARYSKSDRPERSERPARAAMMYDATCSQCGNECQVPFRPNGRKPVLCSNCFVKQDSGAKFGPKNFDRPRFGDRAPRSPGADKIDTNVKQQLDEINAKLARILAILDERV